MSSALRTVGYRARTIVAEIGNGKLDTPAKNAWLAELLGERREALTEYWIDAIRAEQIISYQFVTDERLRNELPPTIDSMIEAFATGDTTGPRQHSVDVIQRRLSEGFLLPDLQMSLHGLETAVMRAVRDAGVGPQLELEALWSASSMYYQVALIAAAVYEQLRAEQQRRFNAAYEFGSMVNKNLDLVEILDAAAYRIADNVGAQSVALLLTNAEGIEEVRAYRSLDDEVLQSLPAICESLGCGYTDVDADRMREYARSASDVRAHERLTLWAGTLAAHGYLSLLCAPLVFNERRLGTVLVLWSDPRAPSEAEVDFLFALAGHTATAVQNAMLYEEARGKRELGVLLDASRLFSSSLNTKDILHKMARIAAEAVDADLAMVLVLDDLRQHFQHVARFARGKKARSAVKRITDLLSTEHGDAGLSVLGDDFARGKPVLLGGSSGFPAPFHPLSACLGSGLVVPMRSKGSLQGAFVLVSKRKPSFSGNDVFVAEGIADLAGVAIENARLYEHERHIAETLQRSILPESLPQAPGYQVAAYYRPAMAEAEIGGDFYDVFAADNGLAIIIGDVSGKGLSAAVSTATGKYMVRAYAAEDPSPVSVISRFNRSYCGMVSEFSFTTAFYGLLNPEDGVFTYVSAGQDPPLLYRARTGEVEALPTDGLCLGIAVDFEYTEKRIQLEPGDALLLYTDGATDAKGDDGRLGREGLANVLQASAHGSAQDVVRDLPESILAFCHDHVGDDIALVVLKRD